PPGSFQRLIRRNGLFNSHGGFRLDLHESGLPSTLISEGQVSQGILARGGFAVWHNLTGSHGNG
ncbi:MAG: hypothetical protein Q8Q28_08575, partial [Pseudomonadota bacterium]|nr:hypothetical protein [Pseudomonadota bacterium]